MLHKEMSRTIVTLNKEPLLLSPKFWVCRLKKLKMDNDIIYSKQGQRLMSRYARLLWIVGVVIILPVQNLWETWAETAAAPPSISCSMVEWLWWTKNYAYGEGSVQDWWVYWHHWVWCRAYEVVSLVVGKAMKIWSFGSTFSQNQPIHYQMERKGFGASTNDATTNHGWAHTKGCWS
jgi:hypothetical protein